MYLAAKEVLWFVYVYLYDFLIFTQTRQMATRVCCVTNTCDASCFSTRHLSLRFRKCQMKIVPRFQDLKWQKWWPTMIQMNCHLLCWCQRVWTNLAGCCSKIWRNRPTWCFHLSAFQLLLLCSPLVQKGTPSHRWNSPSKSVTSIYSLPHFYFQIRESLSLPSHPETMAGYRYTQWIRKWNTYWQFILILF